MIPLRPPWLLLGLRVPRVGGGDPGNIITDKFIERCSPRRRG